MVKIHGNWCGPNWTAGQKKPASKILTTDLSIPCLDKLDCGCKQHDISIAMNGPSFESDERLRIVAAQEALMIHKPIYAAKAKSIAAAMQTTRWFRGATWR